jgi:hypothetical protein
VNAVTLQRLREAAAAGSTNYPDCEERWIAVVLPDFELKLSQGD